VVYDFLQQLVKTAFRRKRRAQVENKLDGFPVMKLAEWFSRLNVPNAFAHVEIQSILILA
jgi:hypothetical protein